MIKQVILIVAISFISISCGNSSIENSTKQLETIAQEEHQHSDKTETINLINGAKWKVDAEMLIHIRSMENDVSDFNVEVSKNYDSISEKLLANIDLLTSNCTMQGQAHDELHKWLLPYIDLVKELSKAKDQNQAAIQFAEIQSSFKTFNKYFN
jgi:hypothetical protein